MEQRLSIITLGVRDIKKSKAFYDALGWKSSSSQSSEEIVAYDLTAMTLALYPLQKLAEDANIQVEATAHSTITLAYNVSTEEDVETTLTEAVNAGGNIVKPAEKAFWGGYSGYFADPDGTLWEVACNPFSKLGENGEFQWNGVSEPEE